MTEVIEGDQEIPDDTNNNYETPLYQQEEEIPWKPEQLEKAVREKRVVIVSISDEQKTEVQDTFTLYTILIELQLDTARIRWEIQRRYQQLFQLHSALSRKHSNLPSFPPKTIVANKNSLSVVTSRSEAFKTYLSDLLQNKIDISATSSELHDFLETRKRIYGRGPIRRRILIPLPVNGFEVSQVSVAWKLLTIEAGYVVDFCISKENKTFVRIEKSTPDPLLNQPPPSFASMLAPNKEARLFYAEMEESDEFQNPLPLEEIDISQYDAILLTGGYTQGVYYMTSSETLISLVREFCSSPQFLAKSRVIASIDRGALVLAKCVMIDTNLSIVHKRKLTTLPKWLEKIGNYFTSSFNSESATPSSKDNLPVSDQVRSSLEDPNNLLLGPVTITAKGTWFDHSNAFVVEDENFLSGRWTGDIYLLTKKLIEKLDRIELQIKTPKQTKFKRI